MPCFCPLKKMRVKILPAIDVKVMPLLFIRVSFLSVSIVDTSEKRNRALIS